MFKNKSDGLSRELKEIRVINKVRRKMSYRKNSSKIDRFRAEIMYLHQVENASLSELQRWLRDKKRIKVARSTIMRRINQWVNGER